MDPWNNSKNPTGEVTSKTFEDDFEPNIFAKLPDSEQYLASLEAKLHKIRTDPDVMKQLQQKREECMSQLLNSCSRCSIEAEAELDEPIESSPVMRTIAPQKQALTQGEVVELVKYDQLRNEEDDTDSAEEHCDNN